MSVRRIKSVWVHLGSLAWCAAYKFKRDIFRPFRRFQYRDKRRVEFQRTKSVIVNVW